MTTRQGSVLVTNLNHVLRLVESLQCFPLSELQKGDLGRDQPAEQIAEDWMIPEGNDVLDLPEDGARVPGKGVKKTKWKIGGKK